MSQLQLRLYLLESHQLQNIISYKTDGKDSAEFPQVTNRKSKYTGINPHCIIVQIRFDNIARNDTEQR